MQDRVNALSMLEKDMAGHIDMISAIVENRADLLYVAKGCVLLREKGSDILQLACEDVSKLASVASYLEHAKCVVAHDELSRDALIAQGFKSDSGVYQCYYPSQSIASDDKADIRKLDASFIEVITQHYHLINDPEYIAQLIDTQGIYGLFVEGELAGFIGSHDDGSMGLLEIFEPYRKQGYAYKLENYLIHLKLAERKIPYCQVFVDNEASMGLQRKLGMQISEKRIYWLDR